MPKSEKMQFLECSLEVARQNSRNNIKTQNNSEKKKNQSLKTAVINMLTAYLKLFIKINSIFKLFYFI